MFLNRSDGLISTEDKLMLLCARSKINVNIETEIKSIIHEDIDWDYIVQRSSQHRLTTLLYWHLNSTCPDLVPDNVMAGLKDVFDRNIQKNLLILGELLKIMEVLKARNITFIPYKGPVMSLHLYGNLSLRQFDDLDIFIYKNDFFKVKDLLITQGYRPYFHLKTMQENFFHKTQREYRFLLPDSDIRLEIQWKFYGVGFSFSGNTSFLDNPQNLKNTKINQQEVFTLSPEDLLLVLCIHASGHLWERLAWIVDIYELISSENLDWNYTFEKSTELGIKRLLMINLLLAVDLLDLKLPPEIHAKIESDIALPNLVYKIEKMLFKENSGSLLNKVYIRLIIREKRTNMIMDFFRVLILPDIHEWTEYQLPTYLLPLIYLFRILKVVREVN